MRQLQARQGATAGLVVSLVLSAAASALSTEPLQTFGYFLAVTLSVTLLATLGLLAINRRSRPTKTR